ncbi:MAG: hypothetical protein B7X72_13525 [Sphingobacteriia bacterium 39-39-8]|jgi:hypothetical protein|nr:MAG: hypothetical protein B7X72_13525 [Sphingobacteriia bacterium 39-39-8]
MKNDLTHSFIGSSQSNIGLQTLNQVLFVPRGTLWLPCRVMEIDPTQSFKGSSQTNIGLQIPNPVLYVPRGTLLITLMIGLNWI